MTSKRSWQHLMRRDEYARHIDPYEYGLPTYYEYMEKQVEIIKREINSHMAPSLVNEVTGTVPKLEVVETEQTGRDMTVALVSYGTKRTLEAGKKQESELEKLRRQNKEMLALLENISAPRRGSEEASWEIPPRLVQLAARLVDEVTFEE